MKKIKLFSNGKLSFSALLFGIILFFLIEFAILVFCYFRLGQIGWAVAIVLTFVLICIFLFGAIIASIVDSKNQPDTSIFGLILMLIFCFFISVNKVFYIAFALLAICILCFINYIKKNYILKYSNLVILLLTLLLDFLFMSHR